MSAPEPRSEPNARADLTERGLVRGRFGALQTTGTNVSGTQLPDVSNDTNQPLAAGHMGSLLDKPLSSK
jgi:hypothetical protein